MARFLKKERLSSRPLINLLFSKGRTVSHTPLKIVFHPDSKSNNGLPQILIGVPKRQFKKSVDRNLLKRRIREAYRNNKGWLIEAQQKGNCLPSQIAFLYTSKDLHSFQDIEHAQQLLLEKLIHLLNSKI